MAITRIATAADTHAAFDTLARTLDQRLQRRRVFSLLAGSLAAGVLGTTSLSQEAAAKRKGNKKKGGKKRGKGNGNNQGTTPVQLQTCATATECGTDSGATCAPAARTRRTRESAPGSTAGSWPPEPVATARAPSSAFLSSPAASSASCPAGHRSALLDGTDAAAPQRVATQ